MTFLPNLDLMFYQDKSLGPNRVQGLLSTWNTLTQVTMHIKDFSKILIKNILVFGVLIYMGAAGVFFSILHPTLGVCIINSTTVDS